MRGQQNKIAAQAGELRLRTRTALVGLEDKDLAEQAQLGVQRLIKDLQASWQRESVVRDILSGLNDCAPHARKLRYRCSTALSQL